MKDFVSKFLVFFTLVSLSSCDFLGYSEEDKPDAPDVNPEITISSTDIVLSEEGSSSLINFTCNGTWIASSGSSWLTVSQANGFAGEVSLGITAQPNDSYDERNAVITISSGSLSKNITVTQKQKNAILLTSDKLEVKAEGGEASIEVKSNVSYTYEIEENAQSWISVASTRAMTTSTINLIISKNTSSAVREGKITITDGTLKEVVTVYQQGQEFSLILTQKEYEVAAKGDTIKVELQSDTNYSVEMPKVNWIHEISSRAMTAYTHLFVVDENKDLGPRECEIKFVNADNGIDERVKVSQNECDTIHVEKTEYRISYENQVVEINVDYNVEYTYDVSAFWIEPVSTRSMKTDKLQFNVLQNNSSIERSVDIVISSVDGEMKQIVTIVQGHENSILVESSELKVGYEGGKISFTVNSPAAYTVGVNIGSDWISVVKTESDDEEEDQIPSEVCLEIEQNKTELERTGIVVLTNTQTHETTAIRVIQGKK